MSEPAEPPRVPMYKNPYVIGFAIGVVALTALPFIQKGFLAAPPPIRSLGTWQLQFDDGATFDQRSLAGRVWIAGLTCASCSLACLRRAEELSNLVPHLADLRDEIALVSLTVDPQRDTVDVLKSFRKRFAAEPRWRFSTGTPEAVESLSAALTGIADAGPGASGSRCEDARFYLIDDRGNLRGAWPSDDLGRGNIINAARLLVRLRGRAK